MIVLTGRPDPEWLGFAADGRLFAAGPMRSIEILDPSGRRPPEEFAERNYNHMAFGLHPGGRWAYVHRADTRGHAAVDRTTGRGYFLDPGRGVTTYALAVAPDGRRVLLYVTPVLTSKEQDARIRKKETGDWLVCYRQPPKGRPKEEWRRQRGRDEGMPVLLTFLPDGERFAAAEVTRKPGSAGWNSRIALRDAATGEPLASTRSPTGVDELDASPDGRWLVARCGTQLTVWALDSFPARPRTLKGDARRPFTATAVAFHPSGRLLAVSNNDTTVKLYDTGTWAVAKTYSWNVGRLRSVAFSPDGTLAAAGSDTGKIVVWDVDL